MELRELFATFGLDFDQKSVDQAETGLAKLGAVVKSFGAAIASTAVLKGLTDFVLGISQAAQEISNLSQRASVTTTEIQQTAAALAPLGLNLEATSKLFEELNIRAGQAAQGGGPAAMFRELGVAVKDGNGNVRSGSELFLEVTDRISEMGSASERTNALNQLMAEGGRRLGPALSGGNNQLREMVASMGGLEGITPDVIEQSRELAGHMARLDLVTNSLKNELARELLPIFIRGLNNLKNLSKGIVDVVQKSNLLKAAVITLGTVLVAWGLATAKAWLPAALTFGGVALAVAILVLVVDDLITAFEGGNSAIGAFLDASFGAGTTAELVEELKKAWDGVKFALEFVAPAAKMAFDLLRAGLSRAIFGVFSLRAQANDMWTNLVARADLAATRIGMIFDNLKVILKTAFDVLMLPVNTAINAYERLRGLTGAGSGGSSEAGVEKRGETGVRFARVPQAATAAVSAGGGRSTSTTVSQTTQVPITIVGNPSREEMARLQRVVEATIDQRNREALASLVPEPA